MTDETNIMYNVDEHINTDVVRTMFALKHKQQCDTMIKTLEQINSDTINKTDFIKFVEQSHDFANDVQYNIFD